MRNRIPAASGLILGIAAALAPAAIAGEDDPFLRPFAAPPPLEMDVETPEFEEAVPENIGVLPDLTSFLAESLFPQSRAPAKRPLFDFRHS